MRAVSWPARLPVLSACAVRRRAAATPTNLSPSSTATVTALSKCSPTAPRPSPRVGFVEFGHGNRRSGVDTSGEDSSLGSVDGDRGAVVEVLCRGAGADDTPNPQLASHDCGVAGHAAGVAHQRGGTADRRQPVVAGAGSGVRRHGAGAARRFDLGRRERRRNRLGTAEDDALARLRTGEATSLVLLTATALGLASWSVHGAARDRRRSSRGTGGRLRRQRVSPDAVADRLGADQR